MIEPSPGVPPHIALLLNEPFDLDDVGAVRKQLKGMARELRAQAEASRSMFAVEVDSKPGDFRVVLSGGLDLLSGNGACQMPICRMNYAKQVARSIALMADQVVMNDFMEEDFLEISSRPKNSEVERFIPDIYVLKVLAPLVKAGVLQFIAPYMPACQGCISEFDRRTEETANEVFQTYAASLGVERTEEYVAVDAGPLYDPHLFIRLSSQWAATKGDEELMRAVTLKCVRAALWDARNAAMVGGSLFSNSEVGLSGLLTQEGRRLNPGEFQAFAGQRAAQLPWVQGLSVSQTLELRHEASAALPALREFLAKKLSAHSGSVSADTPHEYVIELREQAAAVRSELAAVTSRSPSLRRDVTGILGLGVSALSYAAQGPFAALSTLLTTLGLIHAVPAPNGVHEQLLKSKPGYVLVAAQDILAHA